MKKILLSSVVVSLILGGCYGGSKNIENEQVEESENFNFNDDYTTNEIMLLSKNKEGLQFKVLGSEDFYFIDHETAKKHKIENLEKMQKITVLSDIDGMEFVDVLKVE